MVFSSITFLFYFLPIVLGIYYIVPNKWKKLTLLLASMFFYFYGEPKYVLIMIISIIKLMYLKYTNIPVLTHIDKTKNNFECFLYLSIKIPNIYVMIIETNIITTYVGSP